MQPVVVAPFCVDETIAREAASQATFANEFACRALTWAADEHVLCSLAVALWAVSRTGNKKTRAFGTEALLSTIITTVAPHLIKRVVNQKRPDRTMVHGLRRGIPKSGNANDAFPSGHAMHAGAVASLIARFYTRYSAAAWTTALLISGTRVMVLAHWASDVIAGLGLGWLSEVLLNRAMRTKR